jgi:hypothetical protein
MFIIERRTAGVLAALAVAAALVVLGNVWDPLDVADSPTTAISTTAPATSVGPGVRPPAFAANEARTAREAPDDSQSR